MDVGNERVMGSDIGEGERGTLKIRERDVLFCLLSALWGFITGIAGLPFSASPFGFAALAVSSRYAIGVLVGLACSCALTQNAYELLAAYLITLLIRVAFGAFLRAEGAGRRMFTEHLSLRMVSAASGALALGIYRLVRSGFLYYHVIGTLIAMSLAATLVFVWYSVVPKKEGERRISRAAWRTVALCSMATLAVYAFSGIVIFGISPSVFLALTLTLFASHKKGLAYGVLIAICTGIFISVTYAPLFILAAVSFTALKRVSLGLGCFSALAVGMAWGVYMTGITALSELFPGLFAASVIFMVLDKLFLTADEGGNTARSKEKASDGVAIKEDIARSDDSAKRIMRLCGALTSLSESIVLVEKKLESSAVTPRRMSGGSLSAVIDGEVAAVKRKPAKKQAGAKRSDDTEMLECRGCFDGGTYSLSYAAGVAVIADCISSIVREAQDGEKPQSEALSKPFLTAHTAGRKRNAPAEKDFCGDSFDVLRYETGKVYAFISDGMGSGRDAARTSELCAAFLRELLPVGLCERGALEMINGFLRYRNCTSTSECAVSADIGQIDLLHSRAKFYKSGAAPTFIFRDGELIRIFARTLPIGIMSELDVADAEIEILAGDVIVMVSDGVTEGREECPELFEFIKSRILTHSADQLADAIIAYTQRRGTQDDVSAVVIKIEQSEFTT